MKQNKRPRYRIIIGTAGVGLALVLAGCGDSSTSDSDSTQTPRKTVRVKGAALEQRVGALVVRQLGLEKTINATDRLVEDLGADTLDNAELVKALEEEFSVEISDEEAATFKTLSDIVAYLEKPVDRTKKKDSLPIETLVVETNATILETNTPAVETNTPVLPSN